MHQASSGNDGAFTNGDPGKKDGIGENQGVLLHDDPASLDGSQFGRHGGVGQSAFHGLFSAGDDAASDPDPGKIVDVAFPPTADGG